MRQFLLIVGILCFWVNVSAQNLGAPLTPVQIKDSVSTNDYDELNPIYVDETKTLFFTRLDHEDNKYGKKLSQDVWYSELQKDSSWSAPKRLGEDVNSSQFNNILSVFDEGTAVLVSGKYTKQGNWYDRGLTVFKRGEGGEWHLSHELKIPNFKNTNDGYLMAATVKGKRLVVSASKSFRGSKNDLFISTQKENGKWSKLKKIKLNGFQDGKNFYAPRLSSTGDTLFFASNDGHDSNIYFVGVDKLLDKKSKDSVQYFKAEQINTKHNEMFISLDKDGEIAFFASDREGTWDIYKIRRFENEKFIKFYGQLMNQYKNDVLDAKYGVEIDFLEVTESGDTVVFEPTNFNYNSTSGEYEFEIPFDKKVFVVAAADKFDADTLTLDTYNKFQYEELRKDLFLKPILFADLKGQIIDSATNEPLIIENLDHKPQISVNAVVYPKAIVDDSSNYSNVKLALLYEYQVAAYVEGYDSIPIKLDFRNQEIYVDTTVNLYVKKKPDPYFHIKFELYSKEDSSSVTAERKIQINSDIVQDTTIGKSYFYYNSIVGGDTELKLHVHGFEDYRDTLLVNFLPGQDSVVKLYLEPLVVGYHMVMENVNFETRKADLTSDSYPALDELVAFMNEYPTMIIEIDGHTDDVGSEKYNVKLSENRANSVRDYLISKGISKDRIEAKGFGFSKPMVPNDSDENRAKNRRVEFTILKAE